MAFVKNNEARIHGIGMPADVDDGKSIDLLPGVNEVSDEKWAKAKEIRLVQHYLESKVLEEVSKSTATKEGIATTTGGTTPPATASNVATAEDLSGYTVAEATDLIGNTYDKALLQKWAKADNRKGIQDAIAKQIEVLDSDEDEDDTK